MLAPFPYFGVKRSVTSDVWLRLGSPAQYIEPFCGSAAMLLAAPRPASLEVICDGSGFIANFWRAVKHQPAAVAEWADYPVSHIDLGARHIWLMAQRERVGAAMQDCDWPGDAKVAGWWLWGQCCWIGSGWCEWDRAGPARRQCWDGVQAIGKVSTPPLLAWASRRSVRYHLPERAGMDTPAWDICGVACRRMKAPY